MPRLKDDAICIRLFDWSETSQVAVLLTAEHGKLRGLAKGSRRLSPSSVQRFSGGFELLTGGQVLAVSKPSTDLATITEWDLQEPYRHLRTNLRAQRLGLYAADVTHALLADEDAHPRTYAAMVALFDALRDDKQHAAGLLRFQWELLDDAGYRPELFDDVHYGEPLTDATSFCFDPRQGGLTVDDGTWPEASHADRGPWRVRRQTVDLLRRLSLGEYTAFDDADAARANRLLCVYLRAIVDRELPTMRIVLDV